MSIEEMQAELEAAGYWFTTSEDDLYDGTLWIVRTPDTHWECHYTSDIRHQMDAECMEHLVTQAYVHLQMTRRYEAMKEFVKKVAGMYTVHIQWSVDAKYFYSMKNEATQLLKHEAEL